MTDEQELLHLRAVLTDLVDLFGWSDASPLHAAMHVQAAVLNLKADAAVARAEVARLRSEVERRRDVYDLMGAVEHSVNKLAAHEDRGAWKEREQVVAYLRANTCGCHDFAGDIERGAHQGEHRREEA